MSRKRSLPIIVVYVASLVITIALLVSWIVYVLQSVSTINQLAGRLASGSQTFHWVVLTVGCVLVGLLIVGLTFQLAQALSERSYSLKQEEFVSNITHEMKSPVAAIKLHAQTLEGSDVTAADVARSIGFILQQVTRMETLVDNVLESSRLVARKKITSAQPVELAPFFARYFDDVRRSVESRGVRLSVNVATQAVVLGSADALDRIMTNLIENAVRFSSRGGEVRCRVVDDGQQVSIEVEDDGIGIPQSELTKVFDRFYQIGREISERRGGTGLGLSIVAGLVKEMRGRVRAVSHDGRPGALFVVTLPAVGSRS
jgi:two-component system, OmpR family, phosphate regulon sensor histidine kinase PhoR